MFKIGGVSILLVIFAVLVINSLLVMFNDDYYTTFGNYRLFAIVSDSMEPTIPTGSMIVDSKPENPADIKKGTVITFKYNNGSETVLITHRVVALETKDGVTRYITKGDNAKANDAFRPAFSDVVGIYTGKKCGFFGSLFGFFQSPLGVSVLIFGMFIIAVAWVVIWYVNVAESRRKLKVAALKKSAQALSNVNLRYDNINEITAVMDVLGMITDEPQTKAESKTVAERLRAFIKAENIELPQTPETAAVLDTLPAPAERACRGACRGRDVAPSRGRTDSCAYYDFGRQEYLAHARADFGRNNTVSAGRAHAQRPRAQHRGRGNNEHARFARIL